MNQIFTVAKREYLAQVRNKTFIVMTFLSPLIMVGLFGIVVWMMSANQNQKSLAVVDESGQFITSFASNQDEIYNFYEPKDIQAIKDTLLESKSLDGILVLPKIENNDYAAFEKGIELTTNGNLGMGFKSGLEGKINRRIEEMKMEGAGFSHDKLKEFKSNLSIKTLNLKDSNKAGDEKTDMVKFFFAMALCYFIFMFILLYGVKVMRSVVEEKNNRVVEIIISSVKPFNLMMGKIMGTTFVALTQFLIWLIVGGGLMLVATALLGSSMDMAGQVNSAQAQQVLAENPELMSDMQGIINAVMNMNFSFIIIVFLIYFFLGYLFFSSIFAAIGSAVDNEADTQQFTYLPMFPMIIAMYGSMTALENPDGPVSFWLSMIPFTSPISMIARLPFGVEWWELALSLTLLIGTTLLMVYIAARIYRVGILMYGKKPSFKEMWKWLRYNG